MALNTSRGRKPLEKTTQGYEDMTYRAHPDGLSPECTAHSRLGVHVFTHIPHTYAHIHREKEKSLVCNFSASFRVEASQCYPGWPPTLGSSNVPTPVSQEAGATDTHSLENFFLDLTMNSKVYTGPQGLAQLQATNSQHTQGYPASWRPAFMKAGGGCGMETQRSTGEQVSLLSYKDRNEARQAGHLCQLPALQPQGLLLNISCQAGLYSLQGRVTPPTQACQMTQVSHLIRVLHARR